MFLVLGHWLDYDCIIAGAEIDEAHVFRQSTYILDIHVHVRGQGSYNVIVLVGCVSLVQLYGTKYALL